MCYMNVKMDIILEEKKIKKNEIKIVIYGGIKCFKFKKDRLSL